MKLGGNEITAIRLGDNEVVAAYLGSTLVWTAGVRLTGALLSTTALTGDMTVARPISGALAAAAALAGEMRVRRTLAGSLAASSALAGDIAVSEDVLLRGALSALSGMSGGLSVARALAGSVAALSTLSGAAAVERVLSGAAAAVSALAGTATVRRALAGSMASTAAFAGDLTVTSSGGLTQKGYGPLYDAGETADLTMSYANVAWGSAPAAGDLVVWVLFAGDGSANPIVDLTGAGWTQASFTLSGGGNTGAILAKVLTPSDVSSPALVVDNPQYGSIGFWVTYTVTGTISALAIPTLNFTYGGTSAPANQVVDSSTLTDPAVAIMIGAGGADDGSPTIFKTGVAPDIDFTSASNQWANNTFEDRFIVNAIVGGESATYSKSDDGGSAGIGNHMLSGYVKVTFA